MGQSGITKVNFGHNLESPKTMSGAFLDHHGLCLRQSWITRDHFGILKSPRIVLSAFLDHQELSLALRADNHFERNLDHQRSFRARSWNTQDYTWRNEGPPSILLGPIWNNLNACSNHPGLFWGRSAITKDHFGCILGSPSTILGAIED